MRRILSTFRDVNSESSARGLAIFVVHVGAGLTHRLDDLIERDTMRAIAREREIRGVDGFHCAKGVALDTWDLNQSTHGITGHSQMMFYGYLGSVFNLLVGSAKRRNKSGARHGCSRTNLALTSD